MVDGCGIVPRTEQRTPRERLVSLVCIIEGQHTHKFTQTHTHKHIFEKNGGVWFLRFVAYIYVQIWVFGGEEELLS